MPYQPGNYVVKYVRADHARYAITQPFAVYNTCPNRCSKRGTCSKGACQCKPGWQGADCSQGVADFVVELVSPEASRDLFVGDLVTVNFTRPAGNNSDYDFIGVYGAASANSSVRMPLVPSPVFELSCLFPRSRIFCSFTTTPSRQRTMTMIYPRSGAKFN